MTSIERQYQDEIDELKEQRTALLEALKNMLKIYSDSPGGEYPRDPGWGQCEPGQYFREAQAAIALCE